MEIQHVRHFIAAAEAGNMTRAAELLGIAQPALSQSLRRMEDRLGVKLIHRSRRGITLNPVGEAIIDELREALSHIDRAQEKARQIAGGVAGTLVVGFTVSAVYEVLPRALSAFKLQSPDVRVELREMQNLQQIDALERSDIDIGILYRPFPLASRLREQVLTRYGVVAAVPAGFSVGEDGEASLGELARAGLIMFVQQQVPMLRTGVLQALTRLDEEYRVVQEVGHTLTALACVAAGLGVALLPDGTRRVQFEGVRYCNIRERKLLPTMELCAVWPARSKPTLADRFAKLLRGAAAAT